MRHRLTRKKPAIISYCCGCFREKLKLSACWFRAILPLLLLSVLVLVLVNFYAVQRSQEGYSENGLVSAAELFAEQRRTLPQGNRTSRYPSSTPSPNESAFLNGTTISGNFTSTNNTTNEGIVGRNTTFLNRNEWGEETKQHNVSTERTSPLPYKKRRQKAPPPQKGVAFFSDLYFVADYHRYFVDWDFMSVNRETSVAAKPDPPNRGDVDEGSHGISYRNNDAMAHPLYFPFATSSLFFSSSPRIASQPPPPPRPARDGFPFEEKEVALASSQTFSPPEGSNTSSQHYHVNGAATRQILTLSTGDVLFSPMASMSAYVVAAALTPHPLTTSGVALSSIFRQHLLSHKFQSPAIQTFQTSPSPPPSETELNQEDPQRDTSLSHLAIEVKQKILERDRDSRHLYNPKSLTHSLARTVFPRIASGDAIRTPYGIDMLTNRYFPSPFVAPFLSRGVVPPPSPLLFPPLSFSRAVTHSATSDGAQEVQQNTSVVVSASTSPSPLRSTCSLPFPSASLLWLFTPLTAPVQERFCQHFLHLVRSPRMGTRVTVIHVPNAHVATFTARCLYAHRKELDSAVGANPFVLVSTTVEAREGDANTDEEVWDEEMVAKQQQANTAAPSFGSRISARISRPMVGLSASGSFYFPSLPQLEWWWKDGFDESQNQTEKTSTNDKHFPFCDPETGLRYLLDHPLLRHWYGVNGNIQHHKFTPLPSGFVFYHRNGEHLFMDEEDEADGVAMPEDEELLENATTSDATRGDVHEQTAEQHTDSYFASHAFQLYSRKEDDIRNVRWTSRYFLRHWRGAAVVQNFSVLQHNKHNGTSAAANNETKEPNASTVSSPPLVPNSTLSATVKSGTDHLRALIPGRRGLTWLPNLLDAFLYTTDFQLSPLAKWIPIDELPDSIRYYYTTLIPVSLPGFSSTSPHHTGEVQSPVPPPPSLHHVLTFSFSGNRRQKKHRPMPSTTQPPETSWSSFMEEPFELQRIVLVPFTTALYHKLTRVELFGDPLNSLQGEREEQHHDQTKLPEHKDFVVENRSSKSSSPNSTRASEEPLVLFPRQEKVLVVDPLFELDCRHHKEDGANLEQQRKQTSLSYYSDLFLTSTRSQPTSACRSSVTPAASNTATDPPADTKSPDTTLFHYLPLGATAALQESFYEALLQYRFFYVPLPKHYLTFPTTDAFVPASYDHTTQTMSSATQNLTLEERILDFEDVSPLLGIERSRVWEALALGAIPILQRPHSSFLFDSVSSKTSSYASVIQETPLWQVYEDLPVVVVNDPSEITLENLEKWRAEIYEKAKRGEYQLEKLFSQYWIDKIYGHTND